MQRKCNIDMKENLIHTSRKVKLLVFASPYSNISHLPKTQTLNMLKNPKI